TRGCVARATRKPPANRCPPTPRATNDNGFPPLARIRLLTRTRKSAGRLRCCLMPMARHTASVALDLLAYRHPPVYYPCLQKKSARTYEGIPPNTGTRSRRREAGAVRLSAGLQRSREPAAAA